jgi:two-component system response regulator HydG
MPALRERIEDIEPLAGFFLKTYCTENKKIIDGFSNNALEALARYTWPGNLDELANTIEKIVVLSQNKLISVSELPSHINQKEQQREFVTIPIGMKIEDIQDLIIKETLKYAKGDKTLAAKILGITPRTIYRKVGKGRKGNRLNQRSYL